MLARLTSHRVLSLVLIWALLLCHGAFGALHMVADPVVTNPAPASLSTGEPVTAHHASGHHEVAGQDDRTGHERQANHAGAEYFAVLLGTIFGGLALWALRRNASRRHGTSSAKLRSWGTPPAIVILPRGPTLTLLQAFRL